LIKIAIASPLWLTLLTHVPWTSMRISSKS